MKKAGSAADSPATVSTAALEWTANETPRSKQFDDLYFSAADGFEESRYVFLEGNGLASRWQHLTARERFLIGETGFGSGLNFLAAWELWERSAPDDAHLEYLGAEAYPLTRNDLARALARWKELAPFTESLLAHYPRCLHGGVHRLSLIPGRVTLNLLIGDATEQFEDCLLSSHPAHRRFAPGINAWFLDGFAPAKNPSLWQETLYATMQALSAPGATLATFTAAGHVRRGLSERGFSVERRPGFRDKRHMTRGELSTPHRCPSTATFLAAPRPNGEPLAWDVSPDHATSPDKAVQNPSSGPQQFTILGAGLAGCHAARALAERGIRVTLLDQSPGPASGGSGNRQGVLYAKPAAAGGLASDFNLAALQYAQRHYERFWTRGDAGRRSGVLHLARDERDAQRQRDLMARWPAQELFSLLDGPVASDIAGIALQAQALWFPDSGWLAPPELCRVLLDHPLIDFRQARVTAVEQTEKGWQLRDETDSLVRETDILVLACALGLEQLPPAGALPVQAVRGQVSDLNLAEGAPSRRLRVALCGDGYVTPPQGGKLSFGASFVPGERDTGLREAEHEENLQRLRRQFPGLLPTGVDAADCSGRAALRCASPDRLPMVGPVPDVAAMSGRFALLRKNADAAIAAPGAFYRGLFVSAAYGSRGLAYIPLATELLCWHLTGGAPPLSRGLRRALHPARFLVRDLIRNKK